MIKVKFAKCLCSHGVVLCAYRWNSDLDCIATYYPLYNDCQIYDKNYSWLEKIMRSVHFDHQFDEIDRWRAQNDFLIRKRQKEKELKAKLRYEKLQRNLRTA